MPWQVCGRAAGHLRVLQSPGCAMCGRRKKEWISELLRPLGGWHYELHQKQIEISCHKP
jgi:hypothetical protein